MGLETLPLPSILRTASRCRLPRVQVGAALAQHFDGRASKLIEAAGELEVISRPPCVPYLSYSITPGHPVAAEPRSHICVSQPHPHTHAGTEASSTLLAPRCRWPPIRFRPRRSWRLARASATPHPVGLQLTPLELCIGCRWLRAGAHAAGGSALPGLQGPRGVQRCVGQPGIVTRASP